MTLTDGFMPRTPYRWPLTELGRLMPAHDLFMELEETISVCNNDRRFDRLLLQPDMSDVTIDRERGVLTALCQWAPKSMLRVKAVD